MNGNATKIFDVNEDMLPDNHIQDTITNTRSINEIKTREMKKVIRNIMYMIESNFENAGGQGFKRVRKSVLDNVNDLGRYFEEEILFPVYEQANKSIESLEIRVFELEKEKRSLKDLVERITSDSQGEEAIRNG